MKFIFFSIAHYICKSDLFSFENVLFKEYTLQFLLWDEIFVTTVNLFQVIVIYRICRSLQHR